MKKKIIFAVMLSLMLTACSNSEGSKIDTASETTATQATETTTAVTTTKKKTTTTDVQPTKFAFKMSEKLDIGKTYEPSIPNSQKCIFFTDNGRYFNSCIDSNYPKLHYDDGEGRPKNIQGIPNNFYSWVRYINENIIYLTAHYELLEIPVKLEDDVMLLDNYAIDGFFTENCVYQKEASPSKDRTIFYKTDYYGGSRKEICHINIPFEDVENFIVYKDKLLYNYTVKDKWGQTHNRFVCRDLNIPQKETIYEHDGLSIVGNNGYINNGYMYFVNYLSDGYTLIRFNIESQEFEYVCNPQNGEFIDVNLFNFIDDTIIYTKDYSKTVCIINENECKEILNVRDFLSEVYGGIKTIQCIDGHIYLEISSGKGIVLLEIDIDGNVIEVIHDDRDYDCEINSAPKS